MDLATWAHDEFGTAELGDKRRTSRLKAMARGLADRPGGKMTRVFEFGAELEGAYRFLENKDVSVEELERARGEACGKRMPAKKVAVVPLDQTTITLREHRGTAMFGPVGPRKRGARGVQAITAVSLDEEGVVLGVLFQTRWLRDEVKSPRRRGHTHDPRPAEERESYYWIRALDGCDAQVQQHAPDSRPWYQADQGADYWRVFAWAAEHDALLTARAAHERVVITKGHDTYLHPWIAGRPIAYRYDLDLRKRAGKKPREARTAHLSVRFGTTTLSFAKRTRKLALTLSVVAVTEPRPPQGAEPIDWLLLSTYPVRTEEDAALVIYNYTLRWRCEEFHRTLKTGACDIEASELESFEAFSRLLVLASSVAARIERIKFLSRTRPDAPAAVAYSRAEIETVLRLRQLHMVRNKPAHRADDLPLHVMTRWVAELGGYRPSRGRGPPGTIVLARGLTFLEAAVLGAEAAHGPRSNCG